MLFQAWKVIQNNFDKKQEVLLTQIEEKTACSFIVPSTNLIPLHASDKKESDVS